MKTDPKAFFTLLDHAQELTRQRDALLAACNAALNALDGFDSLQDDDSRAEAYADELQAGFAAKDQLRNAIALCSKSL